jgi:hypothetical protein
MSLSEVALTPRTLLRTLSQHQRGVLSGNPEAGWGRVPFFTHLSHVSGEMQSSPEPVARSTNSGTRSRGRSSCFRIVTRPGPPPIGLSLRLLGQAHEAGGTCENDPPQPGFSQASLRVNPAAIGECTSLEARASLAEGGASIRVCGSGRLIRTVLYGHPQPMGAIRHSYRRMARRFIHRHSTAFSTDA